MGSDYHLVSGGRKFIHGFNGILTTVWYMEDLNSFMVLNGFDYRLVSGGLKFIHGFNGVLTTLWYHQTCLPSDEFEKKQRS